MKNKKRELILMTKKEEARVRREAIKKIKKASNARLFDIGCTLRIIDTSDAWERPLHDDPGPLKFTSDRKK